MPDAADPPASAANRPTEFAASYWEAQSEPGAFQLEHAAYLAFFAAYFSLAVFFVPERATFDAATTLMNMFHVQGYQVEFRILLDAFFRQSLAIAAIALDREAREVIFLHTISPVINCMAIFLIVRHLVRDAAAALMIVLWMTIDLAQSFFFIVNQQVLGCFAILCFSILMLMDSGEWDMLSRARRAALYVAYAVGLIECAVTSHPVAIAFVLLLGLYCMFNRRVSTAAVLSVGFTLAVLGVKFVFRSDYEAAVMGQTSWRFGPEYLRTAFDFLAAHFHYSIALLVSSVLLMLAARRFLAAIYLLAAEGVLLLAIGVAFKIDQQSELYLHYQHGVVALMPIVGLVCAGTALPLRWRRIGVLALALVIALNLTRILAVSGDFTERSAYYSRILSSERAEQSERVSVDRMNYSRPRLLIIDAHIHSESLMYSALTRAQAPKTIVLDPMPPTARHAPLNYLYEFPWYMSRGEYLHLNTPGNAKSMDLQFQRNIEVRLVDRPERIRRGATEYFEGRVININDNLLHSGRAPDYTLDIECRWEKDGIELTEYRTTTPLEVDVVSRYRQPVKVTAPSEPGEYNLIVGFVLNDTTRFGSRPRPPVVVY